MNEPWVTLRGQRVHCWAAAACAVPAWWRSQRHGLCPSILTTCPMHMRLPALTAVTSCQGSKLASPQSSTRVTGSLRQLAVVHVAECGTRSVPATDDKELRTCCPAIPSNQPFRAQDRDQGTAAAASPCTHRTSHVAASVVDK
jgi:hypothetical protein